MSGLPALKTEPSARDISIAVNRLIREFNRLDRKAPIIGTDTGTSTAYAITPAPGIVAYEVGQEFIFQATHANTSTTPTLDVNGIGAGTITSLDGSALANSDIPLNAWVRAICTATTPTFAVVQLLTPTEVLNALLTTRGDLLTRGASALQRLALGTPGQVLTSNGTDPLWQTPTAYQGALAFVSWSGGGTTISRSYNVSSITRNGAGDYTINITNALPANAVWTFGYDGGAGAAAFWIGAGTTAPTTTALRMICYNAAAAKADATTFWAKAH